MAKLDKSTIGEIGVRERSVNMDRSHFIEQSTKTWSAPDYYFLSAGRLPGEVWRRFAQGRAAGVTR